MLAEARSTAAAPPLDGRVLPGRWKNLGTVLDEICAYQRQTGVEPRLAIALSGGGATGAYQAGALRALLHELRRRPVEEQVALRPQIIVGSSVGALNALACLIEELELTHPLIATEAEEPYAAALWRVLSGRDRASQFVLRHRWLLRIIQRLRRRSTTTRLLVIGLLPMAVFLANPILGAWLAQQLGLRFTDPLMALVLGHPLAFSLAGALTFTALFLAVVVLFRRALFDNRALGATICNAVYLAADHADPHTAHRPIDERAEAQLSLRHHRPREERASRTIVRTWYEAWQASRRGERRPPPDVILTATDLCARRAALFALVDPGTAGGLDRAGWQLNLFDPEIDLGPWHAALGRGRSRAGWVAADLLVRCVLASTALPGCFPSQQLTSRSQRDGRRVHHHLVDGGVLHNAPVHVAIDAGATHVLSFELEPVEEPQARWPVPPRAPRDINLVHNLASTLTSLLERSAGEDIRRAAAWNRALTRALAVEPGQPIAGKRVVPLYRVAPRQRLIGALDFDGQFAGGDGQPTISLGEWLRTGYQDLSHCAQVWDATFDPRPEY
jgi:predicted acylesterase/phospholipase RssA